MSVQREHRVFLTGIALEERPVTPLSTSGVMATSSRSQVGSGLGRIGVAVVANGSSWPVLMDGVTVQTTTTEHPVARPGEAIPVRVTLLTPVL